MLTVLSNVRFQGVTRKIFAHTEFFSVDPRKTLDGNAFSHSSEPHGNHWRSTFRGWRLVECAIRTCNRSLTKKRALSLQVRYPHDRDHVPIVVRLLFCVLVAGPDEVLLRRKGLSFLLNPQLPFGDMADHGIHHRGTHCLRCRLHDDIAHRDGLKTGDDGWCLAIVSAHHHTWPRRLILVARGLSGGWLHHGRRSRCQPDSQC